MQKHALFGGFFALMLVTNLAQATINVGIQAPRGALKVMSEWSEMGSYLKQALGEDVQIVPVDPAKTVDSFKQGSVDYLLSNPVLALTLMKKNGATSLVTLNRNAGNKFGGVIISKKGSNIKTAADLKGKSVLAFKFKKSAAAYVFQVQHLMEKGIDPYKDFGSFKESNSQDNIVLAVKNGLADAGFIKTGLLEAMQKEGKIKMDEFEIVDKVDDGFAHVHSTKLYPEWTVVFSSKADKGTTDKLKAALLKLGNSDAACKKARIAGFVEPLSFDDLDNTMRQLKLGPYK